MMSPFHTSQEPIRQILNQLEMDEISFINANLHIYKQEKWTEVFDQKQ